MIEPTHDEIFQEPDRVPRGLLLRIAVGTVAVGLSLCVIAYLLLRAREAALRPSLGFAGQRLPPPHEVASVREEVFTIAAPKPTPLEVQARKLERYGWVDRARGVVNVPIEVGMELVVGDANKGRARP